jgi:large subunit ribosomal protein L18
MKKNIKKIFLQQKRRYLKKIVGSNEKPRLSVFKSHKHIYGQLIDDNSRHTLAFASTLSPEFPKNIKVTSNQEAASRVGEILAKKALEKNITKVVFDRGSKPYHGRIKSLAEAARKEGLNF